MQGRSKLTPSTAGSSWTLRRGVGSSTARSFTSEARNMMYWYGSWTGGINSGGGLRQNVNMLPSETEKGMVSRKATE